jgi:hypothetical protein
MASLSIGLSSPCYFFGSIHFLDLNQITRNSLLISFYHPAKNILTVFPLHFGRSLCNISCPPIFPHPQVENRESYPEFYKNLVEKRHPARVWKVDNPALLLIFGADSDRMCLTVVESGRKW